MPPIEPIMARMGPAWVRACSGRPSIQAADTRSAMGEHSVSQAGMVASIHCRGVHAVAVLAPVGNAVAPSSHSSANRMASCTAFTSTDGRRVAGRNLRGGQPPGEVVVDRTARSGRAGLRHHRAELGEHRPELAEVERIRAARTIGPAGTGVSIAGIAGAGCTEPEREVRHDVNGTDIPVIGRFADGRSRPVWVTMFASGEPVGC